ncbi:ankyrin repeat family protein, partial [Tanacetum coccineum]
MKAIRKGDWVKAREIVDTEEVTWTSELYGGNTAFYFAVGEFKDNEVVRDIVNALQSNRELLETTVDIQGVIPVHNAAVFGNTEALKIILDYNPKCLFICDRYSINLAINCALEIPEIETFQYLFKQMQSFKDEFDTFLRGEYGLKLLHQVIDTGLIDVAYKLIKDYPTMATQVYDDITPLERIIRKPDLFYSGAHYNMYQRFVYRHIPIENNSLGSTDHTVDVENQETPRKDKFVTKHTRRCFYNVPHVKHLKEDKVQHNTTIKLLTLVCKEIEKTNTSSDVERLYSSPFCLAVENDTDEAIDVLTTYFQGLDASEKDEQNVYQLTVLNRSEKVYRYSLHHDRNAKTLFLISKDDDGNNILHLAGRLAPMHKLNAASGAALQMQRELQWFEEVKRVVGIAHTRELNDNKETPMMVFRKEHKELRKEGEEWMKKTADSYTITAALIITIVFAAAITVPGGNDSTTGKPIYETKSSLIIFAISDAISLFTSTTSLLLFLSILTARYADEDFLYKLPKR